MGRERNCSCRLVAVVGGILDFVQGTKEKESGAKSCARMVKRNSCHEQGLYTSHWKVLSYSAFHK